VKGHYGTGKGHVPKRQAHHVLKGAAHPKPPALPDYPTMRKEKR
jgi:hypothetical protein